MEQAASNPLLQDSKRNSSDFLPKGLPSSSSATALALGSGRSLVGLACLVTPITAAGLFGLSLPTSATLPLRLLGCRELVLGALTLQARSWALKDTNNANATENLRRLLWANFAADTIDVLSCLVGEATGTLDMRVTALVGASAALFAGMGLVGARAL